MVSAIIVAAGKSERFGSDKLSAILAGMPVLMRTIFAFQSHPEIDEIILVVHKNRLEEIQELQRSFKKIAQIIPGGESRQESSTLGVLESKGDLCLVHNGANPLVTQKEISEVIKLSQKNGAAFVARKCISTIKKVEHNLNNKNIQNKNNKIDQILIKKTIQRKNLVEAETPQGFKKALYLEALKKFGFVIPAFAGIQKKEEAGRKLSPSDKSLSWIPGQARDDSTTFTDEMSLLENNGVFGIFVEASPQNRKITTAYDLSCAEAFLKPHTRTGLGHDSHKFKDVSGNITLAGTQIPHLRTFEANSDGDVITHALCNAIGTAIGEGSLSKYADEMCKKGIKDSLQYLIHIKENMIATGYSIGNIAISIEGKEPKLEKHVKEMKKNLAETLDINPFQIGIACTTGENLTSFGKGEGIQSFCSVQLIKI